MEKLTSEELFKLKDVKSEFFTSDNVVIGYHEGYKYENGQASFGLKFGPSYGVSHGLFHEMGHLAEVQELSRLIQYGFGMEIKTKTYFLGKCYNEPRTWNATKLELRVILWQEVLNDRFCIKFDREEFAKALQYMPDFIMVPLFGYKWIEDGYYNDQGVKFESNLKKSDSLRFESMYEYMKEQKSTGRYTYDNFKSYWLTSLEYFNSVS